MAMRFCLFCKVLRKIKKYRNLAFGLFCIDSVEFVLHIFVRVVIIF